MVLMTAPAMRMEKRSTPRRSMARRRLLLLIQVMLRTTARTVRHTPSVMKNARVPRRRVRFMLEGEYSGRMLSCAATQQQILSGNDSKKDKSKGRLWRSGLCGVAWSLGAGGFGVGGVE